MNKRSAGAVTGATEGGNAEVMGEAADWLVRMQEGELSAQEQRVFREWRQRSKQHEEAWQRAQTVLGTFGSVPDSLGQRLIPELASSGGARQRGRRRVLAGLGGIGVMLPAAWLLWRQMPAHLDWSADYSSAVGEVRNVVLPDGSLVIMNTASAIALRFTGEERRVRLLAGEIIVQTHRDTQSQARPFLVETAQGTAQAQGTRYSVRQLENETSVAVFEGRVMVRRLGDSNALALLQAGEALRFGAHGEPERLAADDAALMWRNGMLLARDMRLGDLLAELGRYRHGLLRCSPAAANLRVSGAFPLKDTDASLALLLETMPLQVVRRTRYWITVKLATEAS